MASLLPQNHAARLEPTAVCLTRILFVFQTFFKQIQTTIWTFTFERQARKTCTQQAHSKVFRQTTMVRNIHAQNQFDTSCNTLSLGNTQQPFTAGYHFLLGYHRPQHHDHAIYHSLLERRTSYVALREE